MPDFVLRVLDVLARADQHDAVWWRTDGAYGPVTFWVTCSDVFEWGTSDLEPLTEDSLPQLELALKDTQEACGSNAYGPELYCARRRGQRPQGAAYPKDERLWPLFDATGPPRRTGFGNPHAHPDGGN